MRLRAAEEKDYGAIVAIANQINPEPTTPERLRQRDEMNRADPKLAAERLVVEDGAGRVVAYGVYGFDRNSPDRRAGILVHVAPDGRRQGVGSLLYAELERRVRETEANQISASVRGEDAGSLAWALSRGYLVERDRTESVLDLTAWDRARFADAIERTTGTGLELRVVEVLPDEMLGELYACDLETSRDHPEYDGHDQPYDDWLRWLNKVKVPSLRVMAMDGERIAGYTWLQLPDTAGQSGYTMYTCVRREYRKRGVGLAVKLVSIDEAIKRGVTQLRTNNNPENGPMLAVNTRLGYKLIPGPKLLKKVLKEARPEQAPE